MNRLLFLLLFLFITFPLKSNDVTKDNYFYIGGSLSYGIAPELFSSVINPKLALFNLVHGPGLNFNITYEKFNNKNYSWGFTGQFGYRLNFINGIYPFLHDGILILNARNRFPFKEFSFFIEYGAVLSLRTEYAVRSVAFYPMGGIDLVVGCEFDITKEFSLSFSGYFLPLFTSMSYPDQKISNFICDLSLGLEVRFLFRNEW